MPRRASTAVSLAVFLLATGLQLVLHAHLGDDRHHAAGCADDPVAAVHTHPLGAHPSALGPGDEPPGPRSEPHGSCARCASPTGDLRTPRVALLPPQPGLPLRGQEEIAIFGSAGRLGYSLRGPPASS